MTDRDAFGVGINFPLGNPESKYGGVLKGAGLMFLSFLVIPWFTLLGYSLRLRESATRGDEHPPLLNEWGALTKEGFFGFLAMLPASIIYFAGLVTAGLLGEVSGVLASLVVIVTFFGFIYAMPAVMTRYAVTRSIAETSTDTSTLISIVSTRVYAIGTLKYIVLTIGLSILYVVSMITIIGPLFVAPYMLYVRHSYWGAVYRSAAEEAGI